MATIMKEAFIKINNLPTKVLTVGQWLTDKPKPGENKLIIVIPGNPGCTGYYTSFIKYLHEKTKCPVWVIGYTGHEEYKEERSSPDIELIGLREQIRQKVTFIKEYVPPDTKLFIVGHSIGSYMTLELLKEPSIEKMIAGTYLLFPTIEKMEETPNGRVLGRFVKLIVPLIVFFTWFISVLPINISMRILKYYMIMTKKPLQCLNCLYEMLKPSVIRQIFYLAFQELEQVRERDDETIRKNTHRICALYGEYDNWSPKTHYDSIQRDFVNIEARMSKFDHDFVFNYNEAVSDIVHKWICKSK